MQSAPKGSYRVEQLLEFFDQLLPVASRPEDACCLYVDWFSAHLSDEVWELVVETKGHMLAYHGGGLLESCRRTTRTSTSHYRSTSRNWRWRTLRGRGEWTVGRFHDGPGWLRT